MLGEIVRCWINRRPSKQQKKERKKHKCDNHTQLNWQLKWYKSCRKLNIANCESSSCKVELHHKGEQSENGQLSQFFAGFFYVFLAASQRESFHIGKKVNSIMQRNDD